MQVKPPVIRVVDRYRFLPGGSQPYQRKPKFQIGALIHHRFNDGVGGPVVGYSISGYVVLIDGKRKVIGWDSASRSRVKPGRKPKQTQPLVEHPGETEYERIARLNDLPVEVVAAIKAEQMREKYAKAEGRK